MNTYRSSKAARLVPVVVLAALAAACAPVAYYPDQEPYYPEREPYASLDITYHDYWYYPDVDSYYDPVSSVYIYYERDRWVRARALPVVVGRHPGRHVVVRGREGRPYVDHERHRRDYGGRHEQRDRDHGDRFDRSDHGMREINGDRNERVYRANRSERDASRSAASRSGNDRRATTVRRDRQADARGAVDSAALGVTQSRPTDRRLSPRRVEPTPSTRRQDRQTPRQGRAERAQAVQPAARRGTSDTVVVGGDSTRASRRGDRAAGDAPGRDVRVDTAQDVRNEAAWVDAGESSDRAHDGSRNIRAVQRMLRRQRD